LGQAKHTQNTESVRGIPQNDARERGAACIELTTSTRAHTISQLETTVQLGQRDQAPSTVCRSRARAALPAAPPGLSDRSRTQTFSCNSMGSPPALGIHPVRGHHQAALATRVQRDQRIARGAHSESAVRSVKVVDLRASTIVSCRAARIALLGAVHTGLGPPRGIDPRRHPSVPPARRQLSLLAACMPWLVGALCLLRGVRPSRQCAASRSSSDRTTFVHM
jgi:hypothetical protein